VIYKISIIFLINLIVFYFEHKFRRVARLSESAVVALVALVALVPVLC
jgi:hypothetical protein